MTNYCNFFCPNLIVNVVIPAIHNKIDLRAATKEIQGLFVFIKIQMSESENISEY